MSLDDYTDDELAEIERRRNRFRILVCLDGSDEAYCGVRHAGQISHSNDVDIIMLFVRPIDQGLRTGGLQIRLARENMLEWGLSLPGPQILQQGLDTLTEVKKDVYNPDDWMISSTHVDIEGDPLGDNKVIHRNQFDKTVVLKLKTAPDSASGILDQYELGPYNLMMLGAPSHWASRFGTLLGAGPAQRVIMMAPCSVMVVRGDPKPSGHFITTDGSEVSLDAVLRHAVLAHHCKQPITLFSVAPSVDLKKPAEEALRKASDLLQAHDIPISDGQIGIGKPVDQIVHMGRDYSVIGVSHHKHAHARAVFGGSVAYQVMAKAATSVLNVR
ncbi:MAG: universal stress protein [Alphaproteobacteria bacterium]|jgi:nucleotide-binding universal stress UspA family protein|nr:universal stress protein [Alphaproteobacteria bacterium]